MSASGAGVPGMDGLHTDQGPPLSIPSSFFLLAPLAMITSGMLLLWGGEAAFATRWAPLAMAATHLGTLGFLGSVMLGALYQMIPVVGGAPVPVVRIAYVVQALFAAGVAALVVGLTRGDATLLAVAPALLLAGLVLFLVPVALALARSSTWSETVWGLRFALLGLAGVATLGLLMALVRGGHGEVRGNWLGWISAHAALGGVVWVGGLVVAVSWQAVPMFYLTPPLPQWSRLATLASMGFAVLAVPCVLLVGGQPAGVSLVALPAVVMVWWVHPVVTLRAIRRRRRRRVDGSVKFWWAGLVAAPAVPLLAAGALFGRDPRWAVALGWLAIWGWAGMIAHGMLTRIVPFLVWFHRYAALVGKLPVPSMRGLLPEPRIQLAMVLHVSAVIAGLAAILSGWALFARLAGALLTGTGVVLMANLVHTLAPRPLPPAAATRAIRSAQPAFTPTRRQS